MSEQVEIIKMNQPFQAVMRCDTFKILDEDERIIEGYAATSAVDKDWEIITKEALAEAVKGYMMFPTVRIMHKKQPIGKAIDFNLDYKGLKVKAKILKGVRAADEAWIMVKEGVIKAFSVGGRVLEAKQYYDEKLKRSVRKITKMDLIEISLVDVPANPESLIQVLTKSLEVGGKTGETFEKDSCRQRFVNPDGTFKRGFDGCVDYFMTCKGLKKENAQRLCAYIGRQAGKIPGKALDPEIEKILIEFVKMESETMGEEENQKQDKPTVEDRLTKLESLVEKILEKLNPGENDDKDDEKDKDKDTEKSPKLEELVEKIVEEKFKDKKFIRKALKEENAPEQEPEKPKSEGVTEKFLKKRFGVEE